MRGYQMRCASRECVHRMPMSNGSWPEHCGGPMVFTTTFEEERYVRDSAGGFVGAEGDVRAGRADGHVEVERADLRERTDVESEPERASVPSMSSEPYGR